MYIRAKIGYTDKARGQWMNPGDVYQVSEQRAQVIFAKGFAEQVLVLTQQEYEDLKDSFLQPVPVKAKAQEEQAAEPTEGPAAEPVKKTTRKRTAKQ